ncbi:hypothetical protein B0H19DRAFT_1083559 [Mycena capillaripes]|nr:hypothetical protein B0H19DRAFT_1083559 [Mycena capillaripes]
MVSFNRSGDITLGMAGLPEGGWYEPRVACEAAGCRVRREPERGAELRGKVIGGAAVGLVRIGRGGQRSEGPQGEAAGTFNSRHREWAGLLINKRCSPTVQETVKAGNIGVIKTQNKYMPRKGGERLTGLCFLKTNGCTEGRKGSLRDLGHRSIHGSKERAVLIRPWDWVCEQGCTLFRPRKFSVVSNDMVNNGKGDKLTTKSIFGLDLVEIIQEEIGTRIRIVWFIIERVVQENVPSKRMLVDAGKVRFSNEKLANSAKAEAEGIGERHEREGDNVPGGRRRPRLAN